MPHGKRWKVTFFLANEETEERFSMVFENDFEHDAATIVAESAISMRNLLRVSPCILQVAVKMMCYTCGYESEDNDIGVCNCDKEQSNEQG